MTNSTITTTPSSSTTSSSSSIETKTVAQWRIPISKIIVVLPAFNEEENIGKLIESIDESLHNINQNFEIIVVDDGSKDHTIDVVNSYNKLIPITLIKHEINQGLGGTIRDGLKHAASICHERDIVVAMDADNTHPAGLMVQMIRKIREGVDVVIASRYQKGSRTIGVPWNRRPLSTLASILFRIIFPIHGVKDYTCGYRAYRGHILRRAFNEFGNTFVSETGFQCMVDILFKLRKFDIIFDEVPMILRYDHKRGLSKMKITKTIKDTLKLALKRYFNP
ncbi:MAG: glycosyltransferase [Oligoflexia bacterium]|nr:glycosyltransferase [Oligoflexia bacterium]